MQRKQLSLVISIVIFMSFCIYIMQKKYLTSNYLLLKQKRTFTLPLGSGGTSLEKLLSQQNLAHHIGWLSWFMKLEPKLSFIKAGTYWLKPGMTVYDLLQLLVSGKEAQFSIRFMEGSTLKDWLNLLMQTPYLKHDLQHITTQTLSTKLGEPAGSILEGQFYPDTYLYTANTLDSDILKRARKHMRIILKKIWQKRDYGLLYKSPQALLTMASIIEKETGIKEERARIASVFINRLNARMKLQTDSTVIYGMGNKYHGSVTLQNLNKSTPYNTYTIKGLPPTPISMPGKESLEAAAHPEKTSYLYFVSNGKGRHIFSTNLFSHNKAVYCYRKQQNTRKDN